MITSTSLSIYRNRLKTQDTSLFPRVLIAILLAAALITWAPGKASAAKTGEIAWSGCNNSPYWEYFFNYDPNGPHLAQSPCLPETSTDIWPNSSASLYWEYFFANDPNRTQIAQSFSVPVTGADAGSKSSPSQYWEYFFTYEPNGPHLDQCPCLPETEIKNQP